LRFLFCLPTSALSGGVKVAFELIERLTDEGHLVEVFSFAGPPKWTSLKAPFRPEKSIEEVEFRAYDFVLVTNAFFLPLVLPHAGQARVVFLCQDYECFHHSHDKTYSGFMEECSTFAEIYRLPVAIIAISRAVQQLIKDRLGKDSYYVPVGLNKSIFCPQPRKVPSDVKRVLMVGNYLMPYKGMKDGFQALDHLSQKLRVQLVLVTQEHRNRKLFANYSFPVEVHYCPTEEQMPEIIASCDVYCCTSWYEGLGLPALEAFACGVPVVSTRTFGVSDYGIDGVNLLLAEPNSPTQLYEKLLELLLDDQLAERLRQAGFDSVETDYGWDKALEMFTDSIREIEKTQTPPEWIDPAYLRALLDNLEKEGNLTPIQTFRHFQQLSNELNLLCRDMLSRDLTRSRFTEKIQPLRDSFRGYLHNKRAEYYEAFKAKYDLCQLIFALKDDDQFIQYLKVIMAGRREGEIANSASFLEIRYPEQKSAARALD
jgi:glycosyltransferase involved in cell wall biosynthesis